MPGVRSCAAGVGWQAGASGCHRPLGTGASRVLALLLQCVSSPTLGGPAACTVTRPCHRVRLAPGARQAPWALPIQGQRRGGPSRRSWPWVPPVPVWACTRGGHRPTCGRRAGRGRRSPSRGGGRRSVGPRGHGAGRAGQRRLGRGPRPGGRVLAGWACPHGVPSAPQGLPGRQRLVAWIDVGNRPHRVQGRASQTPPGRVEADGRPGCRVRVRWPPLVRRASPPSPRRGR